MLESEISESAQSAGRTVDQLQSIRVGQVVPLHVDRPVAMNGLDLALGGAGLAGPSAFSMPAQPVEDPEAGRKGQGGAQRAQVAAEEFADEQAYQYQCAGIGHKPPFTLEVHDNACLERLDLRVTHGHFQRAQ